MRSMKNIILSFVIMFALVACGTQQQSREEAMEPKTPVTVISVSEEPINETIDLNAVSSFLKKNTVKSPATGIVENIEINVGDNVDKGQLLFNIKTREAAALEKSQITDSSLLFKGLIKIKAPKTGIISSITRQMGDYVQEGDELAVISDQNSLVFLLEVPFELNSYIKKNTMCIILLSDNRRLEGIISSRLPVADMQSQTESFIIKPTTPEKLPENLIAKISIIKSSKVKAFTLPKSAVLSNETQTDFWIMKLINDSTAVKIPVKKGIELSDKVEILQPVLNQSDRILQTGNYGLPDTAKVTIESAVR